MLSKYMSTIKRKDFLTQLNHILDSRVSSSPSLGNSSTAAADDLQSYYTERPDLRKYTLGVEMDRALDYTLILKDGQSISDKDAIRTYFYHREEEENLARHGGGTSVTEVDTKELLIRAANQSLLADALVALTGSEDALLQQHQQQQHQHQQKLQPCIQKNDIDTEELGLIFCGPILSMASTVEKCHFTIDLQRGRVESVCIIAVTVPIEKKRLVLSRAIMAAHFAPGESRKRRSELRYAIQFVKAHHFRLSKTLRNAAISLAKDQEKMSLQTSRDDERVGGKNDEKLSQRSFALFA